jgi:hypothetical protein
MKNPYWVFLNISNLVDLRIPNKDFYLETIPITRKTKFLDT